MSNAAPEPTPPRALPVSALIELSLLLGLMLLVDFLFLDGQRYRQVSPHPFWLLVVLFSVQYATSAGLLTALAASVALLAGNLPQQGLEQDFYAYLANLSGLPLAWVATALALGELRRRQMVERSALLADLHSAQQAQEALGNAYHKISRLNERLETRIAAQLRTVFTIFKAAQAVEQLVTGEVLLGISALVKEVLSPNKFSLYALNNDTLEAVYQVGWDEKDHFRQRIPASSPLFRALVAEQRILSVSQPADQAILEGEGLLAGPIINEGTGQVLGVLKIEETGFLDLHLSTIENFRILCEWVGAAYTKAEYYESSQLTGEHGENRQLMPRSTLAPLGRWLSSLAYRAKIDLWQLDVAVEAPPAELDDRLYYRIGRVLLPYVRTTDLIFNKGDEWTLTVLLPATPEAGVRVVERKLTDALANEFPANAGHPPLSVRVSNLYRAASE